MRALVTGATGFVGPKLLERLTAPIVLSRKPELARRELASYKVQAYGWDPVDAPPPAAAFTGVDAVFHLAGEPVAGGRWTAARKHAIRESRVAGTRNLVRALADLTNRPKVLVSASAVGYYGSRGDEVLTESSPAGEGYLAEVCRAWEKEALAAEALGIRVVTVRVGIVLGQNGGALQKMLPPFRLGLGGPLGNGRQWMPWIHIDDLASIFLFAAEHDSLRGPVNGVAPECVTNKQFTKQLAAALHRPAFFPAPYFGLRLLFGEFASVLFASQRVEPRALLNAGFEFRYPHLAAALADIFNDSAATPVAGKVGAPA